MDRCDWGHATPDSDQCSDDGGNRLRVTLGPDAPPITYTFCSRHMRSTIIKLFAADVEEDA